MRFFNILKLNKNWNDITKILVDAAEYLPDSYNTRKSLVTFKEYLEQNELELAMETLAEVVCEAELENQTILWSSLSTAAEKMRLPINKEYYEEQHQKALIERARQFTLQKPDLQVELHFLTETEGGRRSAVLSGYRPTFLLQGQYNSSCLQFIDGPVCKPGDTVQAYLAFLAPEAQTARLYEGLAFELTEGRRVIAKGTILKILNEVMKAF